MRARHVVSVVGCGESDDGRAAVRDACDAAHLGGRSHTALAGTASLLCRTESDRAVIPCTRASDEDGQGTGAASSTFFR